MVKNDAHVELASIKERNTNFEPCGIHVVIFVSGITRGAYRGFVLQLPPVGKKVNWVETRFGVPISFLLAIRTSDYSIYNVAVRGSPVLHTMSVLPSQPTSVSIYTWVERSKLR